MKQTETEFDLPDTTAAYKQAFAAFQGAKWLHEAAYQQSEAVRAAAEAIGETVEAAALKADKAAAVKDLDAQIAITPEGEAKEALKDLRDKVRDAKSSGEIKALISAASSAKADAAGKAETPEQKTERLWSEVQGWNQKINDKFDELKAKGAIFDEDDEKKREELKKRAAEGDIEAQKQLQELEKQMLEKLRKTQPELAPEISEVERLLLEREKVFKEFLEAKRELGTLDKEKEEAYRKQFNEKTEELKTKEDVKEALSDIKYYNEQRAGVEPTSNKDILEKSVASLSVKPNGFAFDNAQDNSGHAPLTVAASSLNKTSREFER